MFKRPILPVVIRNRYFVIIDMILTALSAVLGFAIRLDVPMFWSYLQTCLQFMCLTIVLKIPIYLGFGLYRRYWRYASVHEMIVIVSTVTTASLTLALLVLGLFMPQGWFSPFPRSALIIDWLLSLFFIGGIRFSVRFLSEVGSGKGESHGFASSPQRVLIVGAGSAGSLIAREMKNNPGIKMYPVGYVDDNRAKLGMHIRGLPVLGARESIPDLARQLKIDQVLIAMPTAPGQAIRDIRNICDSALVPCKTIPGIYELLNGAVQINQIRDVQIEDLLRRKPVLIKSNDAPYLRNKVILITGAGGSIGSELCRQVANRQPRQIILFGHGEYSIYRIHRELRVKFPNLNVVPVIADIKDKDRLHYVFETHHPQVIFHAAAHKHVPLMELNLSEAITNNVMGTKNVIEVAETFNIERFVLISSDKAVNPANIMGATKRIAELLIQDAARRTGMNFVAVRFGNVLGSRGSVVPLFQEQISAGGPVTVTHPEMERYFMTIPEAVYLVLQAAALGKGNELFVLDMGDPVKIVDLARDLITLSGLRPGQDIEIQFSGIRPGEKLSEHLFLDSEDYETTQHDKIFVSKTRTLLKSQDLRCSVRALIQTAEATNDEADIWAAVHATLPESPQENVHGHTIESASGTAYYAPAL